MSMMYVSLMFAFCYKLENLDLSNFDFSIGRDYTGMIHKCNKINEIKGLDNLNIMQIIIICSNFQSPSELVLFDLSNIDNSNFINHFPIKNEK